MKSSGLAGFFLSIIVLCAFGLWIIEADAEDTETSHDAIYGTAVDRSEPYYGEDLPMFPVSDCPHLLFPDADDYPPELPPDHGGLSKSDRPWETVVYDVETGVVTVGHNTRPIHHPVETPPWDPPDGWDSGLGGEMDGRQLITNTTDWPWRSHVKVFIDWPNGKSGGCSGAILDNFHVLTAGHCIKKDEHGGWATMVRIAPGYNCEEMPYYQAWTTFIRTYAGWYEDEDYDHDWAVLTLDRNIGYYTGWMGRITCDDTDWYEGRTMNGAGYPGDLSGGQCLYWDVGPCDDAWEYEIETYIDTAPGMSGMPMWTHYNGPAYIASIHSRHSCSIFNTGACSTRLNRDKYDRIPVWLSLDPPPIDKPDLIDAGPSYSGFGPLTVIPGVTWFEAWSDVRNIGTAEAFAPYNVSYYASTDGEITPSDHFIGTKLVTSSLYSFHQHAADFAGTFPTNIPAGFYWVGWIVDSGGVLDEFDEGNNVGAKFIFYLTVETPDHTVSGRVYTPPDTGIAGVPMTGLPGTPVTNSNGYYSAVVPHQWAGTVTPFGCYTFSPHHRTYSKVLWDLTNQNFTAFVKDCSSQDNDCKTGYCDPNDGECHFIYQHDGFPCDDGLWCTVNGECSGGVCESEPRDCQDGTWCNGYEVCDENADACVPGPPPQCDDYVACTIDTCDEENEECDHFADDTLCDDGNVCTNDFCAIGAGCVHLANSESCDDGLWCSVNDYCSGGLCLGYPRDCSDGIACTGDSCMEQSQQCVHNPRDAVCDDGQWCNGTEWCHETGGCQPGSEACPDDGIFCNGSESCDEEGDVCTHTSPPCNTGQGQPCVARYETCDEANDRCVSSGEDCPDDGLWCNGTELCLPIIGTCGHSTDLSGPQCPDNGVFCDGEEYCDEAGDQCLSDGDPCPDDGIFCNGEEACNEDTGGCDHLNPPDCDDGIPCTGDYCNPETDQCENPAECAWIVVSANGPLLAFPDQEIVVTVDISYGDGVDALAFDLAFADLDASHVSYLGFDAADCLLEGWEDFDCTEADDVISCTGTDDDPLPEGSDGCLVGFHFMTDPETWGTWTRFDVVNLGEDLILMTPQGLDLFIGCTDAAQCDDGLFCTGQERCEDGVCVEGEPVACEDNGYFCDGEEYCDEQLQECASTGNPCPMDELFCNGEEFCSEELQACDTTGEQCPDDGSYCNGAESCDEDLDQCLTTGYPCSDDGLYCNGREYCDDESDQCAHTGDPCADDGLYCNGVESCDEDLDQCVSTGDPCEDNGIFCDGVEHCDPATEQCVSSGDPCDQGTCCDEQEADCLPIAVMVNQPLAGFDYPAGSDLTVSWTTAGEACMDSCEVWARFVQGEDLFDVLLASGLGTSDSLAWETPVVDWEDVSVLAMVYDVTGFHVDGSSGSFGLQVPGSLIIARDTDAGEVTLTWDGFTADVLVLDGPFDPTFAGAALVESVTSPWVDADAGTSAERYYRILNAGTSAASPITLGKRDIAVWQGYNLLAVPLLYDDELWASEVVADMIAQGGDVIELSKWISASATWVTYDPTWPVVDFEIRPGEGFFLKAGNDFTWSIAGEVIRSSTISIDTVYGYAMFGVPTWEFAMASDVANAMIAQGGDPLEISRWLASAGIWQTHDLSWPLVDFPIDAADGYIVKAGADAPFTLNPMNVETAVLSSTEAQVTFNTDVAGVAFIKVGADPGILDTLAFDDRDALYEGTDHVFTLTGLTPGQTYYFEILFLGEMFGDDGGPYSFEM